MVTKKQLLKRIEELEKDNKEIKEKFFNSLKALNKKVNGIKKAEKEEKEEIDKINDWLSDARVDEVQPYINKGVK